MYTNIVNKSNRIFDENKKLISDAKGKKTNRRKKVIYKKQTKLLSDIRNNIDELYLLPGSKVDINKMSLNGLLNFFEQEKQNLDNIWSEMDRTSAVNNVYFRDLNDKADKLSLNISILEAKALEHSVELDINSEHNICHEEIDDSNNSKTSLFYVKETNIPRIREYHQVLTEISNLCAKYRELTDEAIKILNN